MWAGYGIRIVVSILIGIGRDYFHRSKGGRCGYRGWTVSGVGYLEWIFLSRGYLYLFVVTNFLMPLAWCKR